LSVSYPRIGGFPEAFLDELLADLGHLKGRSQECGEGSVPGSPRRFPDPYFDSTKR
jgi:hypothetical protein